ncbi:MAG: hypothetical protein QXM37_05395 [Candidatus Bathyarchaeia archaeon]
MKNKTKNEKKGTRTRGSNPGGRTKRNPFWGGKRGGRGVVSKAVRIRVVR